MKLVETRLAALDKFPELAGLGTGLAEARGERRLATAAFALQ
jgi:hypothetical protein